MLAAGGSGLCGRLQSDSIWVVVLEKLRLGLGESRLDALIAMPGMGCRCPARMGRGAGGSTAEGIWRPYIWCPHIGGAGCGRSDGMMEQLERFLLVASGDELTGAFRTAHGPSMFPSRLSALCCPYAGAYHYGLERLLGAA